MKGFSVGTTAAMPYGEDSLDNEDLGLVRRARMFLMVLMVLMVATYGRGWGRSRGVAKARSCRERDGSMINHPLRRLHVYEGKEKKYGKSVGMYAQRITAWGRRNQGYPGVLHSSTVKDLDWSGVLESGQDSRSAYTGFPHGREDLGEIFRPYSGENHKIVDLLHRSHS